MSKRKLTDQASGTSPNKKNPEAPFGGLKQAMNDPSLFVYADDRITIIKDKYPKAKFHFLVLPKENIRNLVALDRSHVDLLKHMETTGLEIAKKVSDPVTDIELEFLVGYHMIPSMSHLHLHVISDDFDSPCLKTKKHWNSFTTDYFVRSEDLVRNLESSGKFPVLDRGRCEMVLKGRPYCCHKCHDEYNTLRDLKNHIVFHQKRIPERK